MRSRRALFSFRPSELDNTVIRYSTANTMTMERVQRDSGVNDSTPRHGMESNRKNKSFYIFVYNRV